MQDNKDITSHPKIIEIAHLCKVTEAMSKQVICVKSDDSISDVRNILKGNRISGLPVVDNGILVGIISIDNFIKCIMNGRADESVKYNMTTDVKCVYSDEPLIHIINLFEKYDYGRYPVLERSSRTLVGIITKGDIIKCLLKKLETDYHEEELLRYRASHIFKDVKSDKTSITLLHKIVGGAYQVAGEQSGYIKSNLLRLGIPPKVTRRVVIAACEAEMNIIIFTDGGELVTTVEEDRIQVNATDRGPGIPDIEKAMQPGYSTAPDWVREMGFGAGMGLPNIKNCSDTMRIISEVGKGTSIEFVVKVQ